MSKIYVTKSFLPNIDEYITYVKKIWENGILTNQGPLLHELESSLEEYLKVSNFHFVSNGTIALQVGLKSLGITEGEVITTPFSYVATTSTILWERCKPVFVDIEPNTFCIDADKIEASITKETKAILAVHVFGFSCEVEKIEIIAKKYNLKVIYDAAHAFGVEYKGKSLLSYGDISTCSFHATKIFHTIEGGGIVVKDKDVSKKAELIKRFGHEGDDHLILGINAKASEFQAAMGLVNLKHIDEILEKRKDICELYDRLLAGVLTIPKPNKHTTRNYAYYPVLFKDEKSTVAIIDKLQKNNIFPRRYFYPSLNKIAYVNGESCEVSEDVASRILCLPLYPGLSIDNINKIANIIVKTCNAYQ